MSSIARWSPSVDNVSWPQEPGAVPGAGLDWNSLEVALAEAARVGEELCLARLEPHGLGRVVRGSYYDAFCSLAFRLTPNDCKFREHFS